MNSASESPTPPAQLCQLAKFLQDVARDSEKRRIYSVDIAQLQGLGRSEHR